MRRPPSPPGHPVLGNLLPYARDPLGTAATWATAYGDVVKLRIPGMPTWIVSHPDEIDAVLVRDARHYRKDALTRMLTSVLGNGLVTSEGDAWRRHRRLANPAFHHARIASYASDMVELAEAAVDRWAPHEERDLHHDMMGLTLGVVARTLFGADLASDTGEIGEILDTVMASFAGIKLPQSIPTPANLRTRDAVRRLDRVLHRMIEARRDPSSRGLDLLSMLMDAVDDDGVGMDDAQLRDEAATLLTAGHETTASALTFTFYILSQHPSVEARLHAELEAVLGDRAPTFADVPNLRYTDAVVREAMRLYPPVWGVGREALCDLELGGYALEKGTQVFMMQWVTHRDPRWWDQPLACRPERWLDGSTQGMPKQAYFPFGAGPRACIGKRFAQLEAVLLTASIARRYALRLAPGETLDLMPSITLRPRHGLRMVVDRRDPVRLAA
jgi:cytochrome P450